MQLWTAALLRLAVADEESHEFKVGDQMHIWFDKLGPYNNPQENYPYASAGLCELRESVESSGSMGDALEGSNLIASSRMPMFFRKDVTDEQICELPITNDLRDSLAQMLADSYWYSVYIDDLPAWAFLGERQALLAPGAVFPKNPEEEKSGQLDRIKEAAKSGKGLPVQYRLFTHRTFTIHWKENNGNGQVISIDVEPGDAQEIIVGETVQLTYSVVWKDAHPDASFVNRYDRYLETKFFEHKVHWFAILNSFILCLFLCTVVGLILMKTLRRDFSRFTADEIDDIDDLQSADDGGWKHVHGDVFRQPPNFMAFSALYASGCHVAAVFLMALLLAIVGAMYQRRGIRWAALVVYMVTTGLNGYQGGRLYRMYSGGNWKNAMIAQVMLIPAVGGTIFVLINAVALLYGSVHAVRAVRVIQGLLLYCFTALPLHVIGTLVGRRAARDYTFPKRVHHLRRPVPAKHWAVLPGLFVLGGFVPFGCMFIEMYYLFSSFWSYNKVYYVYGFLFAVAVVLTIVIVNVSITCTYVLLNAEDYRWHWSAFLCTATTGVYVFIYSVVYYFHSTSMSGILQFTYYFGSTFVFAAAVALYAGAIGYAGSSWFVHLIYSNVKVE
jgi:transmembrane 9 superfamily protein 3